MEELIIESTIAALRKVSHPRYFESERGYQGAFAIELNKTLLDFGINHGGDRELILEEEYQKNLGNHSTRQRPDLILHLPTLPGGNRDEGNITVWAFKRNGDEIAAKTDFEKLDIMFEKLNYQLGIWINIESDRSFHESYTGRYRQRVVAISVSKDVKGLKIKVTKFDETKIIHE